MLNLHLMTLQYVVLQARFEQITSDNHERLMIDETHYYCISIVVVVKERNGRARY